MSNEYEDVYTETYANESYSEIVKKSEINESLKENMHKLAMEAYELALKDGETGKRAFYAGLNSLLRSFTQRML